MGQLYYRVLPLYIDGSWRCDEQDCVLCNCAGIPQARQCGRRPCECPKRAVSKGWAARTRDHHPNERINSPVTPPSWLTTPGEAAGGGVPATSSEHADDASRQAARAAVAASLSAAPEHSCEQCKVIPPASGRSGKPATRALSPAARAAGHRLKPHPVVRKARHVHACHRPVTSVLACCACLVSSQYRHARQLKLVRQHTFSSGEQPPSQHIRVVVDEALRLCAVDRRLHTEQES